MSSPPTTRPHRALTRAVLAAGLLTLGVVAAWRLPLRTFPEPRYPSLTVHLGLASARSPDEVTRRWVLPIEGALRSLGGVIDVRGHVESEGALLRAELAPGTDLDAKAARLAGPLATLRKDLPEQAFLQVDSAARATGDVHALVWFSGPGADDVLSEVQKQLDRLPEINSTTALGVWERWTRVSVHPGTPHALELAETIRGLLEDRREVHHLGNAIQRGHEAQVLFASESSWTPGQIPIRTSDGVVPLATLADIETRLIPPRTLVRFDEKPSRVLIVRRDPATSPLRADARLREVLRRSLNRSVPGKVQVHVSWSEAEPLRHLLFRGGLVLLLASVLLALFGARSTLRTALWASLVPWLGLAASLNLLWLARLPLDTHTLTALLFGIVALVAMAPLRLSGPHRSFFTAASFSATVAVLVPVATILGGGELRWPLAAPATAFGLTVAAGALSLVLLPRSSGPPLHAGSSRLASWVRLPLRDPVTVLLGGLSLAYVLLVVGGPSLLAKPRTVPRNPADLTVRLTLPPGSTVQQTEHEAESVERFLGAYPPVTRQWTVIQTRSAAVHVEMTPAMRGPVGRRRLETALRSALVTSAQIDVSDGAAATGNQALETRIPSAESLSPALDEEDATFFRFVVRSANLSSLSEAYRRASLRLGALGVESTEISGWGRPTTQLTLEPRVGVAPQTWYPWTRLLGRLTSAPRPLTLSSTSRSYLSVDVGSGWGPFVAPRLSDILETASAVQEKATGESLFRVDERLVQPQVEREDGLFVLPVTVRPGSVSSIRRREEIQGMKAALSSLPLPTGASLDLPDGGLRGDPDALDAWRLAALTALLLAAATTIRTGKALAGPLSLLTVGLALVAPAPWILWTLHRADSLTALALAAAACTIAGLAVDVMVAVERASDRAGFHAALLGTVRRRIGSSSVGTWIALVSVTPLVATRSPLRSSWAVPTGALALGMTGGLIGLFLLLPAALTLVHQAKRWSIADARERRRPRAWHSSEQPPALEVHKLFKQYRNGHRALRGVSFRLQPGVGALLGPNGAGKTTLLRILVGLLHPTRGQVRFRGISVDRFNSSFYRSHIGFLPQDLNAYPGITGEQFLDLWALEKGIQSPQRRLREVERVLDLVELSEHAGRKVRSYSGGMRRRIGFAQALLGDPPLLVVDEPTAGMDLESRLQLRRVLERVSQRSIVLVSTHLTSDVDALADQLLLLARGRLRYDGPQAEFLEAARGKVTELVVPPAEVDELARRFRVTRRVHVVEGVELRILVTREDELPARPVEPTLEEAYLVHLDLSGE